MGWIKCLIKNFLFLAQNDLKKYYEELTYELSDKIIEDIVYEYEEDIKSTKKLVILDENESIDLVMKAPKSFCRLGDGEIDIIDGKDTPFQKYDRELAEELKKILKNDRDDMYVGINRAYYHSPNHFSDRNKKFYRLYSYRFRHIFNSYCDFNKVYLDAGFLGAYYRYKDDYDYKTHYNKMKNLFKDKKILLICGKNIDKNLQNDVFEYAKEKKVIYGPLKDAYAVHKSIIDEVNNTIPKDYLVCIILGMTAKVICSKLTDLGYMAWDIGHLAKDYDVYMQGLEKTEENIDKFWAPDEE